jgi:Pyruvate/2-oxoacid:ferredoxin oxidoreductase delta subunit
MSQKPRPKRSAGAEGRSWRRLVAQVVVRDHGRCWVCFHYGAHSGDHVVPDTEGGLSTPENVKAIHAYPRGCGVCSSAAGRPVYCNEIKGMGSVERARRIIEERTGLKLAEAGTFRPEGRDLLPG